MLSNISIFVLSELGWTNRGGSRTAATFKMEFFVITVNGWKPLIIIKKGSILDVAAVLNPRLVKLKHFLQWITQGESAQR